MAKYEIDVTDEAAEFIEKLDKPSQRKVLLTLDKVQTGMFGKYYSKMAGTDGLYECRVDTSSHWIRFLCTHIKKEDGTLIIVLHGFFKKDNKIPIKEINKAKKKASRLHKE